MKWKVEARNTVSFAVIEALGDFEDMDSADYPPLYESIDWEGLNRLFRPRPPDVPDFDGAVLFHLSTSLVVVDGSDPITVHVTDCTSGTPRWSDVQSLEGAI